MGILDVIEDAIMEVVDPVVEFAEEVVEFIPREGKKVIKKVEKAVVDIGEDIHDGLKYALKVTIEDPIKELTDGIDTMIENFIRIICFMKKTPRRFRNFFVAYQRIMEGVFEEIVAFGQALEMGFDSVAALVYYVSVYIGSYLTCGVQFISNIFTCLPYYILEIIGQILYLPIRLLLWLLFFVQIDLYPAEKNAWNGLKTINDFLRPIIGFHIIHFPERIRKNCYTCIRLRDDALTGQKKRTDRVWSKDMPDKINDVKNERRKFELGGEHFKQVVALHVKRPEDVTV